MKNDTAFAIHFGHHRAAAGLSLRGSCHSTSTAQQLEQAIAELLEASPAIIWADCQRLTFLSWQGQRAIFNANQCARQAGCLLYWCGLGPAVLAQLTATGLHLLLNLLPGGSYKGPSLLLEDVVAPGLYIHSLSA